MPVKTNQGRVVGFTTPPFANTQRRHLKTTIGDAEAAIRSTARVPAGPDHVKCLDFNVQVITIWEDGKKRYIVVGGHWARFWLNGFRIYKGKDGHFHPIPAKQRHWTMQQWVNHYGGNMAALKMLHRKNGDQVLTWGEAVWIADSVDVVLCPELKTPAFRYRDVCEQMVWACEKFNYPLWSMALLKMRFAREKCAAMISAGGHFSLIFGKFRSQARGTNKVAGWKVKPNEIWGPKSARQWLRS